MITSQAIAVCSWHHTELALVSDWSPNLSYWSQMTAAGQMQQPPPLPVDNYSQNKTYAAVIVSDGDNLQVMRLNSQFNAPASDSRAIHACSH